jgi:hypothetical protein
MIENDKHKVLPGTSVEGFRGVCYIPTRPNLVLVAKALKRLEALYWDALNYEELLGGVAARFQLGREAQGRLYKLLESQNWNDLLVKAWSKCFAATKLDIAALADADSAQTINPRIVESAVRSVEAGASSSAPFSKPTIL